jgi:hypothetical protein
VRSRPWRALGHQRIAFLTSAPIFGKEVDHMAPSSSIRSRTRRNPREVAQVLRGGGLAGHL